MKALERIKRFALLVLSIIVLPVQVIVFIAAVYVTAVRSIKELSISFRLQDIQIKKKNGTVYGNYDRQEKKIRIFAASVFKFSKKKGVFVLDLTNTIDTVRHELRHAWQDQQGLLRQSAFDTMMHRRLEEYLGTEQDADKYTYLWSWVEVDARAYSEGGLDAASRITNDEELFDLLDAYWYDTEKLLGAIKLHRHLYLRGVFQEREA